MLNFRHTHSVTINHRHKLTLEVENHTQVHNLYSLKFKIKQQEKEDKRIIYKLN